MMKKIFWLAGFLLVSSMAVQAQDKYGHLNFGNVVALMPATKASDEKLKLYSDSLVQIGQQRVADFQKRGQAFYQKVQSGELAPIQQQKEEQALQQEQAALGQLEQIIQQQVAVRRDELLKPIVAEVEDAIKTFAKENGYVMIFDTSVFNSILYAQDTDDLFEPIKAKLGL